jgi:phosphate transport system substrate-binding protein
MLILVNGHNPVQGLDKATVKKIYQGEIATWDMLGWTGQIRPVSRSQRLASTPFFEKAFGLIGTEKRAGGKLSISYGPGSIVPCSVSNHDALATVIGDPGCVLFLSRGTTGVIRALQDGRVRALAIDGVAPDIGSIASGRYPLLRRMTYAISRTASPVVKDFVTWASGSEAARTQILTCDLVPFAVSIQPPPAPAAR